ncbi:PI-actitoxin-Avd5a-like [Daktulosphaira vitifoliae]|uniref:PI-actitoxin-Avd5a-like n=1 Tax=Daktulosphaira vitifoliae TaxID=58002 RepID=UPI0021AA2715|nr:PI-actitoxin-Avd5a-like [Daktulosphaira vitifoliae]
MSSLTLFFLVGLSAISMSGFTAAVPLDPNNCPDICPTIFEPVCAFNVCTKVYKTFGNECELKRSNCQNNTNFTIVYYGKCV